MGRSRNSPFARVGFAEFLSGLKRCAALALLLAGMAVATKAAPPVVIESRPMNNGRISPMLFGNFIELLDDLVPGMWAEMLNDRSFEGITKPANWCYYDGSLDCCDRPWDTNSTWTYDTDDPFNGARSARIKAELNHPGSLTQSGLAVKKGMTYLFEGHFRSGDPSISIIVALKTELPDGTWLTMASAKLSAISQVWQKRTAKLICNGATDRAVFEVEADGQGNLWADKLSLMPEDNLKGWRHDAIEAIAAAHPAVIRFGGSVCDPGGYRWKTGIGDRDQRVPFPNKVWGRLDPNDVGIDEFCQFCFLTDTAPLICVSYSDGPQNAADLVEYCNGDAKSTWGARRAANGHPAPYGVKYWQIGNEISGDDEGYISQFHQFAAAMKKADAHIEIISSFPAKKLLDRVGRDMACVAPHHYTPDLAACERDFHTLGRLIDQTPGCSRIKIAVTEWNTSGGNWGLERGRFLTLANALANARYLHVLMRHSDKVKIACRSNMANSFCSGIIETTPGGLLKRPSYYVMQLYARHALPIPLTVREPLAGPDIFACASEDGKKVVIFVVNSGADAVDWTWQLEGFKGTLSAIRAESVCDTQNARQPDVMNHWTVPQRVKAVEIPVDVDSIKLPPFSATAIECGIK